MVSIDGRFAICIRKQGFKQAGLGWYHKLEGSHICPIPQTKKAKQSAKASVEILDKAYNQLLFNLTLSDSDRQNLNHRGLTDDQISSLNYKSNPLYGRDTIIRNLQKNNIQLSGVPGFWTDSLGHWHLSGSEGICIPVRDLKGLITGIQIRRYGDIKPKYIWLSSADRLNGCSSGVNVHVAKPGNAESRAVWITEGPLKADIISLKLNRIVIAIPGVACWAKAIPILWQIKPVSVVVALDMDKLTNQAVMTYRNMLFNRLLNMNMKVFEANWNSEYKGLDDFLARGL